MLDKCFQGWTLRSFVCEIETEGRGERKNIKKEGKKGRKEEVVGWKMGSARRYF